MTSKYPHVHTLLSQKRDQSNYKPNIIKTKTFEYDKSYFQHDSVSEDIIERFVDYQTRYPSRINDCIDLFIYCVELLENEHNLQEVTGKPINLNIIHYREQKMKEKMQEIYDILDWEYHILMGISLTDRTNPEEIQRIVYSWMKFITSQTPLNQLITL